MKQTLNLKLGHKLKLTPRLQQAITLLQLSSMELEGEIHNALENNPFLEETEGPAPGVSATEVPAPNDAVATSEDSGSEDGGVPLDVRDQNITERPSAGSEAPFTISRESFDATAFLDNLSGGQSLADYLEEQLRIAPMTPRQSLIAAALVQNINEDGYLEVGVDELAEILAEAGDFSTTEVEEVLAIVQSMDPPGIGARDLRECLLIQLAARSGGGPVEHATCIIRDHFDELGRRDFNTVRRSLALSESELAAAINVIRDLDPRPGSGIDRSPPTYVVPDLVMYRTADGWQIRLNEDAHSKLSISPSSKTYLAADTNREDALYFRQRYQEAKWFLQSLKQRNETILRVAREIMRHQEGFLEHGEQAMKPLTLKQVADALDLHESTVSRATSQKYILSPRGTHELKYFFSSHLASADGDAASSTAIQAQIRTLIAQEPDDKPISDQKIADHFKSRGITVARRTVAKYREQMHIPPSSQRKGL